MIHSETHASWPLSAMQVHFKVSLTKYVVGAKPNPPKNPSKEPKNGRVMATNIVKPAQTNVQSETMRLQNFKFPPVLHKYDALIPSSQQTSQGLKKESLGTVQKAFTNIDGASNEPKLETRRKTESLHKH
jgi:hypothetical protein